MSQTEQERIAIEEQLLLDRIAFGTSWKAIHADGTIERVDPASVRIRVPPPKPAPGSVVTWHQVPKKP